MAQLLKDFQDGLRPELLDKEKAKDLVRRGLLGEKNLKSLTDEIAKELAGELGVVLHRHKQQWHRLLVVAVQRAVLVV